MRIYSEIKLTGDRYNGSYSNGQTMLSGGTMENFSLVEGTEEWEEGTARYENGEGLVLEVIKTEDNGALRVKTVVTNNSDKELKMELLTSFVISGVNADKIHRLQSFWSAEGKLRTETIDEMHLERSWADYGLRIEKFGNVGSMPVRKYFPFLAAEDSASGELIGIQLYTASTWQMEILCEKEAALTISGGLGDRDFGHWMKTLAPGGSFTSPEAVLAKGKSLYDIFDRLVKAQHPDISPIDNDMAILYNEYCTTWGNPTFENVAKCADKLEGKGIKFIVIDSGWYGDETWYECLGDWEVNEERFPGGMKAIADYIRSKGMIPGIWFELETLASRCRYYNDPEHLVKKDGIPLQVGGRRFWDMEDPWVVDYLSDKVIKFLKDNGFGYIKIDYNDTIGMGCDGAESLGEALRRKVEASQEFYRRIRREIPDIVIENCASGGHRLEPSWMSLVSQASFSDAHETVTIPLIAANLQRVISPMQDQIWCVVRGKDSIERLEYSLAATLFGRMCLSGEIYDLSDEQWAKVEEGMEFYRKAADIIKNGKTIQHDYVNTTYHDPIGQQLVVREWQGRRLAVLHRFAGSVRVEPDFPEGSKILAEFGSGNADFTAKAWLYEL
ncbi:MAG: alpha-galactosidase [Clostridiales bacterium]|nr:alpha-galactosidase [Clostridiales bacterium]